MLKITLLWLIVTEILTGSAVKDSVIKVVDNGERVVVSMSDSSKRLKCPNSDKSPLIEKAWYGLTSVTKNLDCRDVTPEMSSNWTDLTLVVSKSCDMEKCIIGRPPPSVMERQNWLICFKCLRKTTTTASTTTSAFDPTTEEEEGTTSTSVTTFSPPIPSTPVLRIFDDSVTEAEVERIEAADRDRAKNFSLEMLEKMFEEKILQVLQEMFFGTLSLRNFLPGTK